MEKVKKVRIGISILFLIVVIPIFIIGVTVTIKAALFPDKIPDIFGYKPMIVLNTSVQGEIYEGDLVFIKTVKDSQLNVDQIIAFRTDKKSIEINKIARITEQDSQKIIQVQSIYNNEKLEQVNPETIEGIYIYRMPKLGRILMIIQEPVNLILIICIFVAIGILWISFTDKTEKKNKQVPKQK